MSDYLIDPEGTKERIAQNLERVRAEREAKEEIHGPHGSDGVIGDAVNNTIGLRLMDSPTLNEAADRAFGDPNAIIGGLAVGLKEFPGRIRGK